jgi:hypothetical protein
VEAELGSLISALEILATTPTLDRNDLPGFRERARRVIEGKTEWAAIVLARADAGGGAARSI